MFRLVMHWVFSEENLKQLIADNRIWFGAKGDALSSS